MRPAIEHVLAVALAAGAALACGACSTTPYSSGAGLDELHRPALPDSEAETEQRRRARIRLELGSGYYQQGKYQVALDELRQALEIDPDYAQAYGVLGVIQMDMGDRVRADESFRHGLALRPRDADLNNSYGWFLCQTGRPRDSIPHFEQALRDPLYPTPAKPLHNAGICAQRMGDLPAAKAYFLRALQAAPGDPVALYNMAHILLSQGDIERAKLYSRRLVETQPPSAEILWLALRVARAAGDADSQASLAMQLRRIFPDSREAQQLDAGKFED